MMGKFGVLFVGLVLIIAGIHAQSESAEQKLIKDLFQGHYDRRIRPTNKDGGPAVVTVNLYLRSVSKLDDVKNELDIQLTYRQKWKDERLAFTASEDLKYLNLIDPQNLTWVPDTFFTNEKEAKIHSLMVRNEFIRVSPSGDITHSSRISMKLACPMNLKYFPFDSQYCPLRLASYGYTDKDLKYVWEAGNPIQVTKTIHLQSHSLQDFSTDSCDSTTVTGRYSCLVAEFKFKRVFSPYLINVYIPCTMFVVVAILSFWIDIKAVTARIVLLSITLLMLIIQSNEMNQTFPKTSYTKAVDMWTGIVRTFVFGALLEFIVVQHIIQRQEKERLLKAARDEEAGDDEEEQAPLKNIDPKGKKGQGLGRMEDPELPEKIDRVSRIAFPAAFILFLILYWIVYSLSPSNK